jgi:hypothetical protein
VSGSCGNVQTTHRRLARLFLPSEVRNSSLRLRRGQAIGSGAVEGAIKQLVNLRMKRTGARWRLEHVGPFVELQALADGPEWAEHWASLAG